MDSLVVQTLHVLKRAGYRIGLITNCAYDEIAAWDSSELAGLVDVPIFSCVEGLIKPDPAIYKLACDRLGVDVSAAVFVGDGGSDELRGADAAGLKAIWATWYIEMWPWDWVENVAKTSDAFPRCRRICDLPALIDDIGFVVWIFISYHFTVCYRFNFKFRKLLFANELPFFVQQSR